MIAAFVYLHKYLFFQAQILLVVSLVNAMYLTHFRPLETHKMNMTELLNEISILLIMHMMNILINPVIEPSFRQGAGYIICAVATINIAGNLILTMVFGVKELIKTHRNNKHEKDFLDRINLKIENRKKLIQAIPRENFSDGWVKEIEMFDALNYCRRWSKYRKWILSNGRSLTDFD
jgi:hypothetical protein